MLFLYQKWKCESNISSSPQHLTCSQDCLFSHISLWMLKQMTSVCFKYHQCTACKPQGNIALLNRVIQSWEERNISASLNKLCICRLKMFSRWLKYNWTSWKDPTMMIPENYYEPRINVGEDLDLFLADFELWVFFMFYFVFIAVCMGHYC